MISNLIRAASPRRFHRSGAAAIRRSARSVAEALECRRLLASLTQLDGVAYLPNAAGDRFERYDVTNERWLDPIVLAGSPGGLATSNVDADGIYAAYGTSVFRYRLDGSAPTHVIDASFAVQRLFTDGNLLIVDQSLSSRGEFISLNKATNALIDAQSIGVEGIAGSSISPAENKIFGHARNGWSSDVTYVAYDDAGHFVDSGEGPRGDVSLPATQTWMFPSGANVLDDSGTVYSTRDLTRFRSLGTHVDDFVFVGGAMPVVLRGDTLSAFAPATLLPTGSAKLGRTSTQIAANARDVVAFVADADAPHGYATQVVPLADLKPFQPGAPLDPAALAYKPDDVEVADDGTLLLLSASNRSIFRFDTQTLAYRPTIALQGVPAYMAYSAENASAYVAYSNGLITRIDLTAARPVEQPFVVLPAGPNALATAGKSVFATVSSFNWQLALTFAPDGSLVSKRGDHDYSSEFVWNAPDSKLFYLANDSSFDALRADSIGADGTIAAVSEQRNNAAGSERPLRVSPDGKVVLLGSGAAYDAMTLQRLASNLGNAVSDVAWIGNDVYTVRTLDGATQFQRWAGGTFAPAGAATAPGVPIALRALGDGRLVGVYRSATRGAPIFRVMDAQLQTLAESTLPALPSLDAASIGLTAGSGFEGVGTLQLNGTATGLAAGQSIARWEYDFDYDGVTFTPDAAGPGAATLNYAVADAPSTRLVAARATDNYGQAVIRTRTVTFANVAPRATFSAVTAAGADPQRVTASFSNVIDVSADVAAGFRYSFDFNNDGDFDDVGDVSNATSSSAAFRFAAPGIYTARGRIADKDGGFTDYARTIAVSDGTNLAAGKTTSAFASVAGSPPSNATDDDSTTEWVSPASDYNWLQVDLAALYQIASIDVAFNAGAPSAFQLQTSIDGTVWATASSTSGNTASTAFASVAGTTARFVRVLFLSRKGGVSFRVGDLRVTGISAVAPAPANVGWDPLTTPYEGSTASLVGRASPLADGQSIAKWEWDLDYDGATFDVDATGQTVRVALPDSSVTRNVAVRVTDNYGQVVIGRRSLTPTNVAPTATFSVVVAGPGKATATFANVVDPGVADVAEGFRYSFDFNGDGNFSGPGDAYYGTTPTATGTYAAGGTYTVVGYVYDRDGGSTKYVAAVTVAPPPPPCKFRFAADAVYEGDTAELRGIVDDGSDGQSVTEWEWDFDYDGRTFDVDASGVAVPFDARQIDGPARRTIGVRVTDRFGQTATAAQELIIRNAPATALVDFSGARTADGRALGSIAFANPTDRSAADRAAGFRYSFDFNGDGDFTDADEAANATVVARSHVYPGPGTYPVSARITDKDGAFNTYSANLVIAGPGAPVPTIAPPVVVEGRTSTLEGGTASVGTAAIRAWEWDFDFADEAFSADARGQNVTFDATHLDGPTTRQVALRVVDANGRVGLVVRTITVANLSPTGRSTFVANANGTATFAFSNVTDPSAADVAAGFKYSFDFNNDGDFTDAGDVLNGTSPSATITYATPGTHLASARITDKDGGYSVYGMSVVTTARPPSTTPTLLAGTPIGTAGSIGGNTIARAFDGSLATYVDLPGGGPFSVGLDLGVARAIASARFAPRATLARRMAGGTFQASNSATFATGVVTLGTVATQPAEGVLTTLNFAAGTATYRYVRYVAPAGSFGNVAELQFFGPGGGTTTTPPPPVVTPPVTPPTTGTPVKLTGTAIGTPGSISGNGFARALDGDLATFVDSPTVGAWVGLDLGNAKTIKQIRFAPRATLGRRMVGGYFQASNSADFSNAATLFTIAAAPADGVLTAVAVANATAYRYVRYVAPANSFGNVAEVQFFG